MKQALQRKYRFEIISPLHEELPSIIEASIGDARPEKIEAVINLYHRDERSLIGCFSMEHLVGVIGVEFHRDVITIHHISVRSDLRQQGIGRELITKVAQQYGNPAPIYAETDDDEVGFYKALGFVCTPFNGPFGRRFCCKKGIGL